MRYKTVALSSFLAISILGLCSCEKLGFSEPPNDNPSGRVTVWSGLEYSYDGAGIQFNPQEVTCSTKPPLDSTANRTYIFTASDGNNSIYISLVTDSLLFQHTYSLGSNGSSVELLNNRNAVIGILLSGNFTLTVSSCKNNTISGTFEGMLYNLAYGGQMEVEGSFDGIGIEYGY